MVKFEKYQNSVIQIGYGGHVYQIKTVGHVNIFQTLFYGFDNFFVIS